MADLFENLNERQREAVLETEGYVRVIAGAGSGKTKLLVSRYAYLVQDYGIDPANILCVTFTNKAAGEMKKRIRALIGTEQEISLICTYHGFCNRLLRENPEKLFLNRQFQIMDPHQQKAVLGDIYQKYELKMDYASFEAMLRRIGYAKRNTDYVPRMCDPKPGPILPQIRNQEDRIVEEFLQRQKATYALDFHDLISFALYLLETDASIREKWQERLNYIMVDEFQDSSSTEMRLVELLSGTYRNLMIVGDPDQNIYEWRGSDVKLLVDFDKTHEPTRTIILNQNYRSTPQILRCANTLIEKNEIRLKKDLFTRNPDGKPVIHYHSKDDYEEMDRVTENIRLLHGKEGFRYSDFAILYRSGFLSRVAEKKLVEKNIPYEIYGGVRFYQRMEILDILAYLKLIVYEDDLSFRRIVNTPRRRFGRAKMNYLEMLRERGAEQPSTGLTLFETLAGHLEENEFRNSDVGDFVRFIRSVQEKRRAGRISEIVNEVTEKSGYETYIRELGDEERLDNLAEFKRIANEFEREFGENLTLEEFLRQIALQSGEDSEGEKDAVKLMTIHSSKGLEFPVVFILGFTEGVFPSSKTLGERKKLGLEEERRLCYVAITRAEKYLFLMESEGTSQNGMQKLISRFLEEIGEENYVRVGRISKELLKESRGYAARLNRELQQEVPPAGRKVGDEVEHHVFGRGRIEAVDEKRGSYLVRFDKLQHPRNISVGYFAKKHERIDVKTSAEAAPYGGEMRGTAAPEADAVKQHAGEAEPAARGYEPSAGQEESQAGELPAEREECGGGGPCKGQREIRFGETSKGRDEIQPYELFKGQGEIRSGVPSEEQEEICSGETSAGQEGIWSGEPSVGQEESQVGEPPVEREESGGGEPCKGQREIRSGEPSEGQGGIWSGEPSVGQGEIWSGEPSVGQGEIWSGEPSVGQGEIWSGEPSKGQEEIRSGEVSEEQEGIRSDESSKGQEEILAHELSKGQEEIRSDKLSKGQEQIHSGESSKGQDEIQSYELSKRLEEIRSDEKSGAEEGAEGQPTDEEAPEECDPIAMRALLLQKEKENTPNLWKRDDVPHSGWSCVGVEDLGAPVGICQMCGYQIIRYAHQMEHPRYRSLSVGCVCAGKMEGDPTGAKQREAEFKKRQTRRRKFFEKKWKRSQKGNEYLKTDGHVVVLYNHAKAGNVWKYSVDNEFCKTVYPTRERAMAAAFDALERL